MEVLFSYGVILFLLMNLSKNKENNQLLDQWTYILLIVYMLILFWILLFKLGVQFSYMAERNVNLIPYRELLFSGNSFDIVEVILNVLIFIPLGIYGSVVFRKWTVTKMTLYCFLISLLVEGIQLVFRVGSFDITDIINNVSGGIIGLIIVSTIKKMFEKPQQFHKFINIVASAGTFTMITFLVLLKLNLLPIRYQ